MTSWLLLRIVNLKSDHGVISSVMGFEPRKFRYNTKDFRDITDAPGYQRGGGHYYSMLSPKILKEELNAKEAKEKEEKEMAKNLVQLKEDKENKRYDVYLNDFLIATVEPGEKTIQEVQELLEEALADVDGSDLIAIARTFEALNDGTWKKINEKNGETISYNGEEYTVSYGLLSLLKDGKIYLSIAKPKGIENKPEEEANEIIKAKLLNALEED